MREKIERFPLKGFMLLPLNLLENYRGVDRHPFEPEILDNEINPEFHVPEGESRIWVFYPQ